MEIKVQKNELIKWRDCQWLQTKNFKQITDENSEKLINSILSNGFIDSFKVWKEKKTGIIWILDGHHRKRALEEIETRGHQVPELLPAEFIQCANKKEATKYCLYYASTYAQVSQYGLREMIVECGDIDLRDITSTIEIPGISISMDDYEKNKEEEQIPGKEVTQEQIEETKEKLDNKFKDNQSDKKMVTCPECGHDFEVQL